jgi:four helix bundle protein
MAGGFKELNAWKVGMDLVESVYRLSSSFPAEERFGLMDQIRRAAVSVPSNIAEGNGRQSKLEFKRFLRIALGSACEVETQILLAIRLNYVDLSAAKPTMRLVDDVGKLIRGLLKSELTRKASTDSNRQSPTAIESAVE